MEGKEKFNYETAENRDSKKGKEVQETLVKILQIIIGFIMAIFHM
ncbi:hypothetical protein SAMN05421594_1253 [Chryseobacterium oleae]|uniref:Uncharacterized protein n=1 Tax=Chryseobacterium oleae TaxID=491207 RepID=A0A1I4WIF0_CHROL|nr:hypothetical protein [Chryseobacterium oleae]SFN13458.1 hypothetical protein SAMN05421594_1253 [Chryseobacterium oleae]